MMIRKIKALKETFFSILFILSFGSSVLLSKNVELVYAKPKLGMFFASKNSSFVAVANNAKLFLIDSDKGNIKFTVDLSNISSKESSLHFVSHNEKTNKLYIGYVTKEIQFEVLCYDTKSNIVLKKFLLPDAVLTSSLSESYKYLTITTGNYNAKIYDIENDSLIFDSFRDLDSNLLIYYASLNTKENRIALLTGTKTLIYNFLNGSIEIEINSISYPIHRVTFSRDDKYLLKYNYGSNLEVFETSTGNLVKSLKHISTVKEVKFVNNDSLLLSRSNKNIYFWNFIKGEIIDSLVDKSAQLEIAKINNKEYLVTGADSLSLWDIETRNYLRTILYNHICSHFVSGGKYFVSGAVQSSSRIFETKDGMKLKDINNTLIYQYLSDTTLFYYFSNDTIFIGDVLTGNVIENHYFPIKGFNFSVQFSEDLSLLSYLDSNFTAYIYDWKKKKLLMKIDSVSRFSVKSFVGQNFAFSKRCSFAAGFTGSGWNLIRKNSFFVVDIRNQRIIYRIPLADTITFRFAFAFSYDERFLFYRNGYNPLVQFDLEKGEVINVFENIPLINQTHQSQICPFSSLPWLAISSLGSPVIYIIDYTTKDIVFTIDDTDIGQDYQYSLDISKDNLYLLTEYPTAFLIRRFVLPSSNVETLYQTPGRPISIDQIFGTNKVLVTNKSNYPMEGSFEIYDILGNKIATLRSKVFLPSEYADELELPNLTPGTYFLCYKINSYIMFNKLLIVY